MRASPRGRWRVRRPSAVPRRAKGTTPLLACSSALFDESSQRVPQGGPDAPGTAATNWHINAASSTSTAAAGPAMAATEGAAVQARWVRSAQAVWTPPRVKQKQSRTRRHAGRFLHTALRLRLLPIPRRSQLRMARVPLGRPCGRWVGTRRRWVQWPWPWPDALSIFWATHSARQQSRGRMRITADRPSEQLISALR